MITLKDLLLKDNPSNILNEMYKEKTLKNFEKSLLDLDMKVPEGYRHKNNFFHSLKVLDNAISREKSGKDIILRTAALFHDIGKPKTREFHKNGVVSFTNHDIVGAKMIREILKNHNYKNEEIKLVSLLIRYHMRSHTFKVGWTDSAVRRLMKDCGSEEQLERLIILLYSDVTSSNKEKVESIHKDIKELEVAFSRVRKEDHRKALRPSLNGYEVMDLLGIEGKDLGVVMKFLNSDEIVFLDKDESVRKVKEFWNNYSRG